MFNWILRPTLLPGESLQGNQLVLARLLSVGVLVASMVLFMIALPSRFTWLKELVAKAEFLLQQYANMDQAAGDVFVGIFLSIAIGIEIGVMLLYCLTAALIYVRRSDDWIALITAAALASFALHITPTLHTWMGSDPTKVLIGSLAKGIGLGLAFMFLYLFPSGYYSPAWMRFFLWIWIVWVIIWLLRPESLFSFRDPYTISPRGFVLIMFWWIIGIFSQIYRFAYVSGPVERQQTKYITFGAAFVLVGYSFYVPLREAMSSLSRPELAQIVFQLVAPYIFLIMIGAIPITIAFSILRYRLWDIDLLIRRTLIYTILSTSLLAIYFLIVLSLQALVSGWMGGLPKVALAGTTLVVVALINPLRRHIQAVIDRRFFRSKYDAEKALARFAALARDETDIQRLTSSLTGVVQDVLQPEQVSLWLPAAEEARLVARSGATIRRDREE